jgi:hypothetical protein
MKKMKMSIVKWLGIYETMLQLELENERLESKLIDLETQLEDFESSLSEKMSSWDVEDMINDNKQYIDMYDYNHDIHSIIDDYVSEGNLSSAISAGVEQEMSVLADSDTLREMISIELDNHPALHTDNDIPDNTTWDMNEIIQEVIEELVNRLK